MQRLTELVHQKRSKHKDNPTNNVSRSFLWCWGNLSRKIPGKHKQRTPLLAESLDTQRIASITCDARHIIIITRDGVIFLWELGRSLKKISKKIRYENYKNRPESLHKLVVMMRNQLPIVSNFEITTTQQDNNDMLSKDISSTLNKRIFYGSDAVKWLMDHEAAFDEKESIRFCQSLLNEGRMECALLKSTQFKNDKSGLYYFSDSRKKISTNYMQKFHAVPADPTLKFAVIASNQHYCYAITQNGKLYQWDLQQRCIDLKNKFIQKQKTQRNRKRDDEEDEDDDEYDEDDDDDESMSDPLDSSNSKEEKQHISMSLNKAKVASFVSDSVATEDMRNDGNELKMKHTLIFEQEKYAKYRENSMHQKHKMRETVKQIASKWIEPKEFFVLNNDINDEKEAKLPEMLLLEKLSCSPQCISSDLFCKLSLRSVSCGHDFVIVLSSNGCTFAWGNGYHGKLGLGNENNYNSPQLMSYFASNDIIISKISCGFDHSLCITDNGEMYSFGSNRNGKLGIGDCNIDFVLIPHKIRILTRKYNDIYHREYIPPMLCADADADTDIDCDPLHVFCHETDPVFEDIVFFEISCGFGHNLAVTAGSGYIYSWGANLCGQLGLSDCIDRYMPTQIRSIDKDECVAYGNNDDISSVSGPVSVIGIGCGAFHSSALSIDGCVFCWGDNSEGQLGIGANKDDLEMENKPKLVDYLCGVDATSICCGADFTFAVSHNFINYENDYFSFGNSQKLNDRKLHYNLKYNYTIPNKPQYRPCGLPLKPRSERRKHQKEIEKLQELFKNKNKNKTINKFHAFIDQKKEEKEEKEEKETETERKSNLINYKQRIATNIADFGGKLLHKTQSKKEKEKDEFVDRGYTENDINRAVEFWCKNGIADFGKLRNSPKLRESVWRVGIPTRLRGKIWRLAIGNALNINSTLYQLFSERAQQINIEMIGNESSIKYISVDLTRTFPSLSYFQDDGPLNETLHCLLQTYCFFRPDRGYIQGMSYLAANLLLYMDSYNAFVAFANLLNLHFFHSMLTLEDEMIGPRIDIFNNLFEYNLPKLFKIFTQMSISPKEYFLDWTISLFTKKLSISVASRVWDIILIFGEIEIYRCCVAILKCIYAGSAILNNENQDENDNIRKELKIKPNELKQSQLISAMKTIKVPKKLKQKLHKLNQTRH